MWLWQYKLILNPPSSYPSLHRCLLTRPHFFLAFLVPHSTPPPSIPSLVFSHMWKALYPVWWRGRGRESKLPSLRQRASWGGGGAVGSVRVYVVVTRSLSQP